MVDSVQGKHRLLDEIACLNVQLRAPPTDHEMLQTDNGGLISTDAMMILDNKESIDGFNANMFVLLEKNYFSAEYSRSNGGGGTISIETQYKSPMKFFMKLHYRGKKIVSFLSIVLVAFVVSYYM